MDFLGFSGDSLGILWGFLAEWAEMKRVEMANRSLQSLQGHLAAEASQISNHLNNIIQ